VAGYVYRGDQPLRPRAAKRTVSPGQFDPELCGTNPGYHQHYRHKQPVCDPCKGAHRASDAKYRAERKAQRTRN
jgi:hypothetical protein